MNEVLRDSYIEDCEKCLERWNRVITEHEIPYRLRLPDRRFHRHIGAYAAHRFDPAGHRLTRSSGTSAATNSCPMRKTSPISAICVRR
jgi:benzoyl-CoA 2,3-epoxidase subunit B